MNILNIFSAIQIRPPGGLWEILLRAFGFIADYGVRIIVFTILLKLVLSPLDFYQRYKMRKNQQITERIQPELDKLKKQFGDDKAGYSRAQMAVQRQNGFSMFSACLPMLVTLLIFFSFFTGMQNVSRFTEFEQYVTMHSVYVARYEELSGFDFLTGAAGDAVTDSSEFDAIVAAWFNRLDTDWDWARPESFSSAQNNALASFNASGSAGNRYGAFLNEYLRVRTVWDFFRDNGIFDVRVPATAETPPSAIVARAQNHYYYDLAALYGFLTDAPGEGIWILHRDIVIGIINNNINNIIQNHAGIWAMRPDGFPNSFEYSTESLGALLRHRADTFALRERAVADMSVLRGIASDAAAVAVHAWYYDNQPSFLWIRSIWVADVPWGAPVPDFNAFQNRIGNRYNGEGSRIPEYREYDSGEEWRELSPLLFNSLNSRYTYEAVVRRIRADESMSRRNGFLILALLAVALSVLSQVVMMRQQKKSGQVNQMAVGGSAGMMKGMMFIMPVMIGVFALFQSSAFALYMITNSAMTLIITLFLQRL